MEEVKCYWETANIVHFCHLLRPSLRLPPVDFETLEKALTSCPDRPEWEKEAEVKLIDKIIEILLQGYFYDENVNEDNLEHYLCKIINLEWINNEHRQNPFLIKQKDDDGVVSEVTVGFHQLTTRLKVEILSKLCEYRLLSPDSSSCTAHLEPEELRLQPIGTDSRGYVYWYFHGSRLYRESPKTAKIIRNRFKKPVKEDDSAEEILPNKTKSPKKHEYQPIVKIDTRSSNGRIPLVTTCDVPLPLLKEAWCVICSTLSEWTRLADNLQLSKIQTDRELGQKLTDEIIPKVQKIFDKKEKAERKEIRKQTFELLPRRTSSRLEIKQIMKEEQEKKAQEDSELQSRLRASAEERRKRQQMYLNGSSNTQSPETRLKTRFREITSQETNRQITESLNEDTRQFYCGLEKVYSTVVSHKDSWPFREPVDEKFAPNYYEIVEIPMDLSVINYKIENKVYSDLEQVESDFKLLVNNCEKYNGPNNKYTLLSHSLWSVFKRAVKNHMNRDLSLDDDAVFTVSSHNPKRPKLNHDTKLSPVSRVVLEKDHNLNSEADKTFNVNSSHDHEKIEPALDLADNLTDTPNQQKSHHFDGKINEEVIIEQTIEECPKDIQIINDFAQPINVNLPIQQNGTISSKLLHSLQAYDPNNTQPIQVVIPNGLGMALKESQLNSAGSTINQPIYILWNG